MRTLLIIALIQFTTLISITAQTTLIIRPDAQTGKDVYLRSLSPNSNYGNHPEFISQKWTNSGDPVTIRTVSEFDLSSIPQFALIDKANLSLYSFYSNAQNGTHSNQTGSNESVLKRITSGWDELVVTWATQPTTTTINQVTLEQSPDAIKHYPEIDVTNLIQDMVDDPTNSHGFLFKLKTEEGLRRMLFGSSDNSDTSLHPKLVITYFPLPDSCIVLKPDAIQGKDAVLRSLSPNSNYGTHPEFIAQAWTNSSNPVNLRSIMDFDLSSINQNSIITSAELSLYTYYSPVQNGYHSKVNGSNESVLQRITGDWDENTVTWNTEPATTAQNQVVLPLTNDTMQHFQNIDVMDIVQDMVNDSSNSHGFMFKLTIEQPLRRMLFGSSDNTDRTLHPKLKVCHRMIQTGIPDLAADDLNIKIYPNPSTGKQITIENKGFGSYFYVKIFNHLGELIQMVQMNSTINTLNLSKQGKGIYYVSILNENSSQIITKSIIIQ